MQRCYEIFESGEALDDRRAAVELLRVVADRRALAWIPELLADEDAEIQAWGAGVLDQMIWSELIDADEAEDLLQRSATMTGTLTETQHGSSSKALLTSTANARRGRSGTRWVTFAGSRARLNEGRGTLYGPVFQNVPWVGKRWPRPHGHPDAPYEPVKSARPSFAIKGRP